MQFPGTRERKEKGEIKESENFVKINALSTCVTCFAGKKKTSSNHELQDYHVCITTSPSTSYSASMSASASASESASVPLVLAIAFWPWPLAGDLEAEPDSAGITT